MKTSFPLIAAFGAALLMLPAAASADALVDGDLTRREFRALNHAYNHQSRFIWRQEHDAQH